MLIRTKLALNLALQLGLVGLLGAALLQLDSAQDQLAAAQARQLQGQTLVAEVHQSSEELTQMARLFVVTREPRFGEYFSEIARIRDGALPRPPDYDLAYWHLVRARPALPRGEGQRQALLDRLRLAGFKPEEFALLDEAKLRSDALIRQEDTAMGLVDGRGVGPKPQDEDWLLALRLTHGDGYLRAKADIMLPLREFSQRVAARLEGERAAAQAQAREALWVVLGLMALLLLQALVAALSLDRTVRQPLGRLRDWARSVRSGRQGGRTRLDGAGELVELSQVIDEMAAAAERQQAELKEEQARRLHAEEVVQHLANHDALTGLPALRLLHDRLERAIAQAQRQHQGLGLLLLDLNDFKPVNDHYGHESGDAVLKAVAQRLQGALREADTVGRVGSDEFQIILPDLASAEAGELLKAKLAGLVAEPIYLAQHDVVVRVGAAIGLALYPSTAADMQGLLKAADQDRARDKSRSEGA